MEEQDIRQALQVLEEDPNMITNATFRANEEKWPGRSASFVDGHLEYLRLHPKTDPQHYISNLRLRIRKSR
jgi:hypothetical protein